MTVYRTGSLNLTRDLNRAAVLRLIAADGPIARSSIARRLGLSPATVTSLTREFVDQGLLRVAERAPSSGGRPAMLLEIVGTAGTAFGVKVAPDHLVGVRVNLDAEVLERYEEPLDCSAPDSPARIGDVLARWLDAENPYAPVLGVGLGVPGISSSLGDTVNSPMLRWRDLPLRSRLEDHLGLPVLVDNDVNTLAIAERLYGRGRTVDHFVTVTLGRGIGLGIVAGGDIYQGFGGGAGEFGHVCVADDGPRCSCGKRGCLEAVAADPALVAQARAAGVISRRGTAAQLLERADRGDAGALAIYESAGRTIGRAVANVVNVLSPELVLVSGEGTVAWPHLAPSFTTSLRADLFPPLADVSVEVDPWDDGKWAVGAASLVLRSTFNPALRSAPSDTSIRARLVGARAAEALA